MDAPVSDIYVAAFNDLLQSFLGELSTVFPEEKTIRAFAAGLPGLVAVHKRKALDVFTEAVRDHVPRIIAKDPAVFGQLDAWGIDFAKLWRGDISDGTRMAIWDYLNALTEYASRADPKVREAYAAGGGGPIPDRLTGMVMDCTKKIESGEVDVSGLMDAVFANAPPELMQSIESLAAECADKMQRGDMDMEALMGTVMGKLQHMDLSALEGTDPTQLTRALGGLGLDAGMLNMASMLADDGTDGTDDLLRMLDGPKAKKKKPKKC